MDKQAPVPAPRSDPNVDEAVKALGLAVLDAEESLLELEEAIAALRIARNPSLARDVELATVRCLKDAMRR